MRVPSRDDPNVKVLIFAAIELTMMAKMCDYRTAQKLLAKILKHYYDVEIFDDDDTTNPVAEEKSFLHC